MSEQNKQIVDECIQAVFTKGDLDAVERYLTPDFVNHDPFPETPGTRDGLRETAAMVRDAFPDWHSTLHRLIAEDDLVAEHFTAQGTHRGEIFGVPPTGNEVRLDGINIFRVRDGKITERWGVLDLASFMAQLGRAPADTSA
jgi:steroid delta-isomerase-like uncharacterized protein